ncbi:STAS domain-containing protein [Azospirillum endophyticum]
MAALCEPAVIVCSGSMTLAVLEETRDRLRDSLNAAKRIEVDCSEVTDASVCFVQLLLAAGVSAARRGIDLRIKQPVSTALQDVLERGGFIGKAGSACDGQEFWIGEP